ncbi:MAG TPA: hypothetical protein VMS64_17690 [Candidatus Methylomirabilis sp.]|nr:hypothetical protein [Candidatus Methylomirabilis sp.]
MLGLLLIGALVNSALAQGPGPSPLRSEQPAALEALRSAKPSPVVAGIEAPPARTGPGDFESVPSLAATPLNRITYPYGFPWATVFKLLVRFTANQQNVYYLCSASSLSSFLIVTAGQCVYSHDILGNGSNVAGWVQEVWAWPAQTDVVGAVGVPDFPYGVAKGTHVHAYPAWIQNSDPDSNIAFIDLDRRIGDRVGWAPREAGVTASSLTFAGYPADGQYGFANNAFQYAGSASVQSYAPGRIYLGANVYGGQIGGPVWRYDGSQYYLQGILATSDSMGNAVATRITAAVMNDIEEIISADASVLAPEARPYFVEYSLQGPGSKGLLTPSVTAGGSASITYNLYNVGFVSSAVTVYFYLSSTPQIDGHSIYIGSAALGTIDANSFIVRNATLTIPPDTPAGSYYVAWTWSPAIAEYPTHCVTYYWGAGGNPPVGIYDYEAAITDQLLTVSSPVGSALQFVPVTPCRVLDTRNPTGPLGGPYLAAGTARTIAMQSSSCGIPSAATAYAVNVTVVPRTPFLNYLTVWPTGQSRPLVSTLNSPDGSVVANAAIVPAGASGSIDAFATDDTELLIDINGFFAPPAGASLQFYALPPCRVLDTRMPAGTFGGPAISGGTSRSFPISSSGCGVPSSASAYSLNVTAVPRTGLGYLTAWPAGQPMPLVSTLNSYDGTVRANAAIVPAGTGGAVTFYASNTTDLVVDISGYFAPPATSGLDFYTVAPCRLVDTRGASGPLGGPLLSGMTSRSFPLPAGTCALPPTAAAYSLNVTAVPGGPLGYLTTWPTGQPQPFVSTLNDPKGVVAANAALVPAGTDGAISIFVTNSTHVVIDTNGYFAP